MSKEDKELLEVKVTIYGCITMLYGLLAYRFLTMIYLSL